MVRPLWAAIATALALLSPAQAQDWPSKPITMRDIHRGDADLALQALELAAHLVTKLSIKVRQRLIEQQQSRLVHNRTRERNPLLLAPG